MCYAIPGRVEKIEASTVIVDYFGEKRKALNELSELSVGDYIYAQGGFVVNKVPALEAESILSFWKEEFFELQEVDLRLSRLSLEGNTDKKLLTTLDQASQSRELKLPELLNLLELKEKAGLGLFYKTANFLRRKYHKNSCCVHGIIEISNYCRQACQYCGISNNNQGLKRYRMTKEQILEAAREAVEVYGFKSLVLQSGEDPGYSIEELEQIIRQIKERFPVLIFISFGEVGIPGLERLYRAGGRGLLMRFETSNPELYQKVHPGMDFKSRIEHLRQAYKQGYLILTGGLVGLPGQTKEDILNDIYLAKNLHAEMYSFGPFLPHPNTPLSGKKPVQAEDVIKVLALARIIGDPEAKILVTTALETLSEQAAGMSLLAGANSLMLNVTPLTYRQLYSIYPNRAHQSEDISTQIEATISLLRSLGRAPTDLEVV